MTPNYNLIPESTLETLIAWITTGRPLGSFTEALVRNDLKDAFARADDDNIRAMFHTVAFLHNKAPIGSWGDPSVLKKWPAMLKQVAKNSKALRYEDGRFGWVNKTPTEAPCKP